MFEVRFDALRFSAHGVGSVSIAGSGLLGALLLTVFLGCGGPSVVDPARVLSDTSEIPARHAAAMGMAEGILGPEETIRLLRRMIVSDGYALESREAAWKTMERLDRPQLARLLELNLPRLSAPRWRTRICELIAEEVWIEMTPTLIRAWARKMPGFLDDPAVRPERLALIEMYGETQLSKVLVQVMLDADPVVAANLRARCWELLVAEGRLEVVVDLLENADVDPDDGLFRDLRRIAGATDVIPTNREEIAWMRALCLEENEAFLNAVIEAVGRIPAARRSDLEPRDLGIIMGAQRIDPALLKMDEGELEAILSPRIDPDGRRFYTADFTGHRGTFSERFRNRREKLDWGDLLALVVASEAIALEPVRRHLFDHAERDLLDTGTEFGGVMGIDDRGRFVVEEFAPRTRSGDNRFVAPQALFDAGYSGLFHFHHHAQDYENRKYAGPHLGDFGYAESTRANCLVFTFIDSRTLNADWYRHGGVVVDLGQISRPD